MDKIDLLYDHYKKSNELSREAQSRRNRHFIFLCCLEAISFWILIRPESAFSSLLSGISAALGTLLELGNTTIQTLVWILVVYILIRYCQDTLYVERQYKYLDKMEKAISEELNSSLFDREGSNYLNDYPMVLNFIDLFYKMLMPIIFFIINIVRIVQEWHMFDHVTLALLCDTIMFLAASVISWFYFFEIHNKVTTWCKMHIPLVDKIASWLRKILKEV